MLCSLPMRWWVRVGFAIVGSAVLAVDCDGSQVGRGSTLRRSYDYCNSDADCGPDSCVQVPSSSLGGGTAFCTHACKTNTDCPSGDSSSCGVGPDGQQVCVPTTCQYSDEGFVCKDGVITACKVAGEQFCDKCGCPASKRCAVGVGCVDLSDLGGPCDRDSDCRTNNCSTFAAVCRAPVGSTCTSDNCDRCLSSSGGWSYCSRLCGTQDDCNGGYCIGIPGGNFACEPPCTGSCPGQCSYVGASDGSIISYCDCPKCSITAPLHDVGQSCEGQTDCTSGDCYARIQCTDLVCGERGWCTVDCATNADCGSAICVSVPCLGSQDPSTCGRKCIPPCDASGSCKLGTCRELVALEGGTARVCDIRLEMGETCSRDSDCQSGHCANGVCADAAGLQNGSSCSLPTDCASGTCTNGSCRGAALLGDVCTTDADCAAGHCCSTSSGSVCASAC